MNAAGETRAELMSWLPEPDDGWRDRSAALSKLHGRDRAGELLALASHALNFNQLTRLGRLTERLSGDEVGVEGLERFKLGLVSNATTELLAPCLVASALRHGLLLDVTVADFGQVDVQAMRADSTINQASPDVILVALDHRALGLVNDASEPESAKQAVDDAIALLESYAAGFQEHCGAPCVFQSVPEVPGRLFGNLDLAIGSTLAHRIAAFNLKLAEWTSQRADHFFDVAHIAASVGIGRWHDARQWYLAKIPFNTEFVGLYAEHLSRLLAASKVQRRKCLVLDLDNTVWGGVVGDDGLEGLLMAEGDPLGEAHREVQRTALALRERGILLAVCSKNDEENARRVFREHPEMLLKEEHISAFAANWNDKASNLETIAQTLNIGVDALVLLDDNPMERAQVRARLPEVGTPELPADPAQFSRILLEAGYFETVSFTGEDRARAGQYQAENTRQALRRSVSNEEDYLVSLQMSIDFAPFNAIGRARIAQLINKTNQYNLTTHRYSEAQVEQMEADPEVFTLQVRLNDRYGDSGMICVVICHCRQSNWVIDTWLMSCRVLHRRVEDAVLDELVHHAGAAGARELLGVYKPSGRNTLVADHFERLGFRACGEEDGAKNWALTVDEYEARKPPIEINSSLRALDSAVHTAESRVG